MHRVCAVNCSISYGSEAIIKGCDFSLDSGRIALILGDNGSGKTTFGHALSGLLSPDGGEIRISKILDDGSEEVLTSTVNNDKIIHENSKSIEKGRQKDKKYKKPEYPDNLMGIMLQNPSDSILATSVERELAFSLEYLSVPRPEMIKRVKDEAERFGLAAFLDKMPEELSGGMKARLAFSSANIKKPLFMVLDEPTNYLDFEGKRAMLQAIEKLKNDGCGIILITQNESLMSISDDVYTLIDGRLERANIHSLEINISETHSKETVPDESSFCQNLGEKGNDTVISFENVSFSYDETTLFSGLSFEVRENESLALLGASSTGKSTLLCLSAGLYEADSGKIMTGRRCGMIFQFPEFQLFDETVLADVAFGPVNLGMIDPESFSQKALTRMNVPEHLWKRPPFTLSGGEKRRVGIAGVIAIMPEILLLDEPSGTLDRSGRALLLSIIKEERSKGHTVIAATHDLDFAQSFAKRAIVLGKDESNLARIFYDGSLKELLEDERLMASLGIGTVSMLYKGVKQG
jgi:energy-coupling factor transporter ATP-binding protein EcfA2